MDSLNILIVEDESLVALELAKEIKALGYNVVEYATNSQMAKKFIQDYEVNLILMDINLGDDINGIELYKSFKKNIPVIYLTAYKDEATISSAISTDPLGYMVKPHKEDELNAILKLAHYKIQNQITKKKRKPTFKTIDIGEGYIFDPKDNKLLFNDMQIKLTLKELQLLKLLIRLRGRIVDYLTIENEIWGSEKVSNTSIRSLVYRLRNKLEHKLIESEHNMGIRLKV